MGNCFNVMQTTIGMIVELTVITPEILRKLVEGLR